MYPAIVQRFPFFNAPLVELVHQVHRVRARPLCFLDLGAAVGDTVLLLEQRCPQAVGRFICVEGNEEFFGLLEENMKQFEHVTPQRHLLARASGRIPDLVRHHPGSAAASGEASAEAVALDEIETLAAHEFDILKVDVDGSDGNVLEGGRQLLQRSQPAVIFEWHPHLIKQTGADPAAAFVALRGCGYKRFLWFTNIGEFSHFEEGFSERTLAKMSEYLLAINHRADEHFDVIALLPAHSIDEVALATMEFGRLASQQG